MSVYTDTELQEFGFMRVLVEKIIPDIEEIDKEERFTFEQSEQFEICVMHRNYNEYRENLSSFYQWYYPRKKESCV